MGLPEAMGALTPSQVEALGALKGTSQGYFNPGIPITSDLAATAPLPELASLGKGLGADPVLAGVKDLLPNLSNLASPATGLAASEAEIAAKWAAAAGGASRAAAALTGAGAAIAEGATAVAGVAGGVGIAGAIGTAAGVGVFVGGMGVLGYMIAKGVAGFFGQSPNKTLPAKYVGRTPPGKSFGKAGDPGSNVLYCANSTMPTDSYGRPVEIGKTFISYDNVQDGGFQEIGWQWFLDVTFSDSLGGVYTRLRNVFTASQDDKPIFQVRYAPPGSSLPPPGQPLVPENPNPPTIDQNQNPLAAMAGLIAGAFAGFPSRGKPTDPLPTRPPVIEPTPPRDPAPGNPTPPAGTRQRDPNTGTTLDRQPNPSPQNPSQPDPTGKGTTTGNDPSTGFTTVVPPNDAGQGSAKQETTDSGKAGCRFQNTNLAGVAQQVTSVAIQTAVTAVQDKANQIKDDTVETLRRIGSGRDPGEGDRPRSENLTAIMAVVRDEVGMRRSRKGRKGKSLVSLGELGADVQERVGFTTATKTTKCDLPKTLENVEDATKDLRERAGFDKKIKKKRNKRDKDGNFLRDELGNLQKEEKSYCSISDALDDQLDEQPEAEIANPLFLVGFEVPAPAEGYVEIVWSQNSRIQRDTAATIRDPKDKLTRTQIVSASPTRYVGDWLCAIAFTNGREISGWFRNEQEGKAYLTRLATLSKLKLAPANSNFTATHRPGKGPDKAKGKSLKAVAAYFYDASGNKVTKLDLRTPKK
jgi:hypothetical protein